MIKTEIDTEEEDQNLIFKHNESEESLIMTSTPILLKQQNKRKSLYNISKIFNKRSNVSPEILAKQLVVNKEDEIDLFLKSLAISIKKLPQSLISQAKLKMLTIVTDLEHQADGNLIQNITIK